MSSESWVIIMPLEICPIEWPAPPDPLDEPRDLPRRVVLDDAVEEADVDAELEAARADHPRELPLPEAPLRRLPRRPREGAVVYPDGELLVPDPEPVRERLGLATWCS